MNDDSKGHSCEVYIYIGGEGPFPGELKIQGPEPFAPVVTIFPIALKPLTAEEAADINPENIL